MKTLHWKKGLFSCTYKIYSGNEQIGSLCNRSFSKNSEAEMNGKKYTFRTKGFFKQSTEVYTESGELVGEIQYNSWMTKAQISLNSKYYYWKYNTMWNTKWIMEGEDQTQIKSCTNSFSGDIDTNTDNELAILSGLYVTNYYMQMTVAVMVAVFIPIFTSTMQ
ncbi:hypothetical protein [Marinifilum caeruleilacunae]|uniref:Uncharacterized protein n=1 Tax=Marinifilum caeruleilacunae TaxID=2499076 RepID=A0ABX1WVS5_9BACT|nr:hypothetical protein [Marinifilum caeruleilacunae]NOU60167.1 hypothetical protein [Marinifilum caeruleilacunae]